MYPSTLPVWLTVCLGRLLVALSAIAALPAQAAQSVTLLLSEPAGIYQEAAQALQRELTREMAQEEGLPGIRWQHVDERPSLAGGPDELVVALGVRALKYALDAPGSSPLLALLVPSLTYEQLVSDRPQASRRRAVSALFLDQPYARQLQLIRLALPETKRVGVLVGPATERLAGPLKKAGREIGLEVQIYAIANREQLFAGLNDLAREVDVLLLLPDPKVVGGETLRALFLQTYQLRLPVVAYAASLVQAGATVGLYATPAQLGGEAGKWIREILGEKGPNKTATHFPQLYTVTVNRNVARTLELQLPSVESLTGRLDMERER